MEQQIYLKKLENKRIKDFFIVLSILLIVFIGISWYPKIGEVKEIVESVETKIYYSQLVSPNYDKEYYHKYTYLLHKKKTLIPFISTYDTLSIKDNGQWSRDINNH